MQKESVLNKKGQEGLTLTTLLLIVLGVVVLVVLIVGFTSGFDFIFDKIDTIPGQQLQAIATSCSIAATNDLLVDYCATLKEVDSKRYVTCDYDPIKAALTEEAKAKNIVCTTELKKLLVQNCKDLNPSANKILTINEHKDINSLELCDTKLNS